MKTDKSRLNVKLLRKIQKHILEEPRRFSMAWFCERGEPNSRIPRKWSDIPDRFPACGTTACIAGWANILTGCKKGYEDQVGRASDKIGIDRDFSAFLFNSHLWPEPFRSRYAKAKTPKTRAKVASDRIDHLIETGE